MHRMPVAIIGIGCRFPGANNPEEFWQLLRDGVDAITEVPTNRWWLEALDANDPKVPDSASKCWGGFLDQVDQFDPYFFGISPREAKNMDPQQRLLLEVAWEAFEDAGQIPKQLAGTSTAVFVGISNREYAQIILKNSIDNRYIATGTNSSIAANRLSYFFDFHGPSLAINTACSSSLVAVAYACRSLWYGEASLALAGGTNLILLPRGTSGLARAGLLSANGRCKTFDAAADGYVRGEGVSIIILKPLSQALANGDPIYAVIQGAAVNQDGRTNGIMAPNPQAQEAVLRQAYQQAGVSPGQVPYIEANSSATKLGDVMEMKALGAVLAEDRRPGNDCAVGSVKTNIGHLEAASGIAGLIKVALSLKYRQIPPSLHFQKPNPHIPFDKLPLRVQQTLGAWPAGTSPALAGVSSFGFGGTNAHVVLAEAPVQTPVTSGIERPLHLLTLRAKSEAALRELARSYQEFLVNHPTVAIADVCFSANTGRSHFDYRLAIVAESSVQLQEALGAFFAGRDAGVSGQVNSREQTRLAFLFNGQGSQSVDLGRQLYATQPTFRQTIDCCNEILRPELEPSLLEVLYPDACSSNPKSQSHPSNPPFSQETAYTQSALFALEYALFQLWKSWGIEPDVVMGHGVGEYVAACVAGVFSLEDGLKLIAQWGRLIQVGSQEGERVAALAAFEQVAKDVTYSCPQLKIVSSMTGGLVADEMANSEYWLSHLRQPVKFIEGIETLDQQGCQVFVEIGSIPTLLEMSHHCLPKNVGFWLLSLCQGQEDWQQIIHTLAELYVHGVAVDWFGFDQDYPRRRVALPTYPFQRRRYWIETDEAEDGDRQPSGKVENS